MSEYIFEKLIVLEELGVEPTRGEIELMKTLKTEIAIDNYTRGIINRCWKKRYGDY